MDSNVSQHVEKLNNILNQIINPDYQPQNNFYLNSLLKHLSLEENKELLYLSNLQAWIVNALIKWEGSTTPSLQISSFTLNMTAILSKDESVFTHYVDENIYKRLFTLFNVESSYTHPSIKLGYVKTLSSFLSHEAGIKWLESNDLWKNCIEFCLANQTIYIIREGHNFILNLLLKTSEEFADGVIGELTQILDVNQYVNNKLFPEIQEEIILKHLRPLIKLILYILHQLTHDDYKIAQLFIKNNVESLVTKLLAIITQNADMCFDLYSILMILIGFEGVIRTKTTNEEFDCAKEKITQILISVTNSPHISNVTKLCHVLDQLWKDVVNKLPRAEQRYIFQNQLLALELLPIRELGKMQRNYKAHEDDLCEEFINELFKMLCEKTIRLCFAWKQKNSQSNVLCFENGRIAIMLLLKNIKNYCKRRGVRIFQTLIYCLKDFNDALRSSLLSYETFNNNLCCYILLLEAIATFINEFDITWRDTVEAVCVTCCTIDFINLTQSPARVTVQALKLLNISIARFMAPNLALLVAPGAESSMHLLGAMIHAKLCDTTWEVRDSCLEVVHTIANISKSKYPIYQQMLIDMDVVNLVVTMSTCDSEGFVRASAIKCLQEMIQVNKIWCEILRHNELPQKMMQTLKIETEGIVRTEAATLMHCIHKHQSFPPELIGDIYAMMSYAATSDLHWEVKSSALDFWGRVVLNLLHDQGYIDGKFPAVTFSKDDRKIVTLNEREIQTRLSKVLTQLSENGCLGVLINAIQHDCDLEVVKKSLNEVKKTATILDKYNMYALYNKNGDNTQPSSPEQVDEVLCNNIQTIDFSDEIIENIINSKDINLLADVYNPTGENLIQHNEKAIKIHTVTPETFVKFIQKDLDQLLNEKTRWLNKMDNLNSLLDDMLQVYAVDEVNTMDCY